jgi:HTH-type transcriptional regulator/antitoxin HipB
VNRLLAAEVNKSSLSCFYDKSDLSCLHDMMDYPIKTPRQLGTVLQGYRKEQRLTQRAVGAKVGLAQNAVSQIEAEPGRAGLARIFKLLAALDLELVVRPRKATGRQADW